MARNAKALVPILIAILTVATAGSATAATPQITAEKYPAELRAKATSELVFARQGKTIKCKTEVDAVISGASETVTAAPKSAQCSSSVGGPATITMNGCDFLFHTSLLQNATSDLICPFGKQVEIDIYSSEAKHKSTESTCTFKFAQQVGLFTIELANKEASEATSKDWLEAHVAIGEITSSAEGSVSVCGSAHDAAGTLSGTMEVKAFTKELLLPTGVTINAPPGIGLDIGEGGEFTAESYPADVAGLQAKELVFARQNGKLTCKTATFSGTLTEASGTLALTPLYRACHFNIFGSNIPATVTTNGCAYLFHLTEDVEPVQYTADVDLTCSEGKQVEIHIYGNEAKHLGNEAICVIKVPAQTGLSSVTLTNVEEEIADISAHIEIESITSNLTGIICGSAHNATATLTGTMTLQAA
jgi:hypothetical protein